MSLVQAAIRMNSIPSRVPGLGVLRDQCSACVHRSKKSDNKSRERRSENAKRRHVDCALTRCAWT